MEAVTLHRVGFLEYFCPKQGQDFKPSAAPQYPGTPITQTWVKYPSPRGGVGVQAQKNLLREGYGYFLEQHIIHLSLP